MSENLKYDCTIYVENRHLLVGKVTYSNLPAFSPTSDAQDECWLDCSSEYVSVIGVFDEGGDSVTGWRMDGESLVLPTSPNPLTAIFTTKVRYDEPLGVYGVDPSKHHGRFPIQEEEEEEV